MYRLLYRTSFGTNYEKLRKEIRGRIKTKLKTIALFASIGAYIVSGFLVRAVIRHPIRKRRASIRTGSFFAKLALKCMAVQTRMVGPTPSLSSNQPIIILANHLSYIDALILIAFFPCAFVTSVEVEQDPFLGIMATYGGCLFIERRKRTSIQDQLKKILTTLGHGTSVGIFPEGTSSNGEKVLPFKPTLMEAAVQSQSTVLPLCIKYTSIDGNALNEKNRDQVCWYGNMSFFPHLRHLLSLNYVQVQVHRLEPIAVDKGFSRKTLGELVHKNISKVYTQV